MCGNGRCGGSAPAASNAPTTAGLHHVEHVLALDERHLEVELAELELPVGAEILVAPARGDLVVAVDPADHAELLEELRRLGEREELARAAGAPARGSRAPLRACRASCVGVQTSTKPRSSIDAADRGDRGVVEAEVPLHPLGRACRASGSGGGGSRRRPPRRAGTAAASSARGSATRRPGPRSRRSAGSG